MCKGHNSGDQGGGGVGGESWTAIINLTWNIYICEHMRNKVFCNFWVVN